MHRDDHTDAEWRARTATKPLLAFYDRLIAELDEDAGAFPLWSGGSDWRTLALIADYLLQAVRGTAVAIDNAALAAIDHRQAVYSSNAAARMAWAKRRETGREAYLWAVAGSPSARRKSQKIEVSLEHCFFHMGQALDRLAAAVLIVGGFGGSVADAYYSTLEGLYRATQANKPKPNTVAPDKSIAPYGSRARELQTALLEPMSHVDQHGPDGWLVWLRDTRNALTHRPLGTTVTHVERDGTLVRPLYREPKFSEIQSVVAATRRTRGQPRKRPGAVMKASLLDRRSDDILDGLFGSLCEYAAAFACSMDQCWTARKADPAAIIQHGTQWPQIMPPLNGPAFDGDAYGDPIRFERDEHVVMHPATTKRFKAARTTDDLIAQWL